MTMGFSYGVFTPKYEWMHDRLSRANPWLKREPSFALSGYGGQFPLQRKLVEARGVEPLSGKPSTLVSTRLANDLVFSELLGPSAALQFLETCLISNRNPVSRFPSQPSK